MRISPRKSFRNALALLLLVAVVPGCVKRMSPAGATAQMTQPRATLQSLKVLDEDTRTRIVLTSDKPFTYTSYKAADPPRVVVDLSQTEPGSISPLAITAGNLKNIDVERQEVGGGVLTRLSITLAKDSDFTVTTDPTDKATLLISLTKPEGEARTAPPAAPAAAESAAPKAPEPTEEAKPEPKAESAAEAKGAQGEAKEGEGAAAPKAPEAQVKAVEEPKQGSTEAGAAAPAALATEGAPNAAVAGSANGAGAGTATSESAEKQAQAAPVAPLQAAAASGAAAAASSSESAASLSESPAVKPESATAKTEIAPAQAKPEPVKGRALTAVTSVPDGIQLAFQGTPETFNTFKLTKPDRIVLDIFGTRSALSTKVIPIGNLGVASARIGTTPDKVRIVLDASQETLPPYEVVKSDSGLKIRLRGVTPKHAAAASAEPAVPRAPEPAAPRSPEPVAAPVVTAQVAKPAPPAAFATGPSAPAAGAAAQEAVSAKLAAASPPAVEEAPARAAAKAAAKAPKAPKAPAAKSRGMMESVDFQIVDGFSRISFKMDPDCIPGKPVAGSQGLSLSIRNCQLPKKLQRPLDTSAFGSQVVSVTPYQVKSKGEYVAKFLVRVKGNPPSTLRKEGDLLVWDIKNRQVPRPTAPPVAAASRPVGAAAPKAATASMVRTPAAAPAMDEELTPPRLDEGVLEIPTSHAARKVYKGRRVTLEFSDADVRKIFQLIAEVSNLNFLISDDVSGTISLKLVNVPWDQALDVILEAKDLGMQRDGNIVQIKPRSRMKNQAEEERAAKAAAENAMELRTMVFEVNYAAVGDVQKQFESVKTGRGKVSVDERTSRIIVKDIQPALDDMRSLLRALDSPEKQVMIEARIVEATSTFTRDLGVQWGLRYRDGAASFANINTVDTGFGGVVSTTPPGSTGTGGLALGMSFGKLTSNVQLDMRLSAAATVGQVKVISTPKVVTLNNKPAKISQGQSIPYQTTSAEGTKTEFVEAALTLEVTPHITADGAVSMKIKASNNSPGTGTPPPINKKEATTELLVANGETTVIGGIYQDSDTETDTGVPFLMDIPLLGWLFKSNTKIKSKTELLIFITPKIVS